MLFVAATLSAHLCIPPTEKFWASQLMTVLAAPLLAQACEPASRRHATDESMVVKVMFAPKMTRCKCRFVFTKGFLHGTLLKL
jgi:hypothetical protein